MAEVHKSFSGGKLVSGYRKDNSGNVTALNKEQYDNGKKAGKPVPIGKISTKPVEALTAEQKNIAGTLQDNSPAPLGATNMANSGTAGKVQPTVPGAPSPTPTSTTPPPITGGNIPLNPQQQATYDAAIKKLSPSQTGFNAAKAGGTGAPQGGSATGNTNSYMPPKPPDTSTIDTALAEDKGYQQLLQDQKDYTHTVNQQTSLLDFYNKSMKQAGIPAIDKELLNAKNIIEGTEDDIRAEVQAASGFATDSQVMALAGARNKQLIKNYNNLLDTKTMAMENIKTTVGLAQQDQQMALQNITQKMQIDEQLMNYRDKFVNNAKEAYNNVLKSVGYAGLYQSLASSGDSSAIGLAEKTLGLQPGQLQKLSTYTPPQSEEDKLNLQLKRGQLQLQQSSLKTDVLQRQKLQQDINGTVGGVDEKTMGKIQASPEYKTINGVLPAIQALTAYKQAIEKYGSTESLSGGGKGELAGTYGNALAAWKSLAGLGALSGADFALAENAVPSTGFFQRNSTMKAKLTTSIDNAIAQASNLTQRLQQNYPGAKNNLATQLDYAKVMAYPDKYKVGPDGQVYELTN